jgi:uncharacterized membrane protein
MTLESSRTLGGVGALLIVIAPLASGYGVLLDLAGLILMLIAFNDLANVYGDRRIFNNVLYGVIATIVGAAIAGVVVVVAAFGIFSVLNIHVSWTNLSAIQNYNWRGFSNWSAIAPYVAAIGGALIILVVCLIVAAIFLRRSLVTLSERSGTHMFATAGLLLLVGAALTIIIVGVALLWVAMILLAVSFFELKTQPAQPVPPPTTTSP